MEYTRDCIAQKKFSNVDDVEKIAAQVKKSTAEALQSPPGIHINQNAVAPAVNKSTINKSDNGNGDVCLTPGCIHAASRALGW